MIIEAEDAAVYWRAHVRMHPYYSPDVESLAVLILDARRRVRGHCLIAIGTVDSVTAHPREVFRAAVVMSAAAIIVVHNHPSGDPSPSEADIRSTRDMLRAGQLLHVQLLDHLVMGSGDECVSLRELGYFYGTPAQPAAPFGGKKGGAH